MPSALPLAHPPGDAQADFGEAMVVIGGVERKAHHLAVDLPQSDDCFVMALRPGEMLAIQRRNVSSDGSSVEIEQRVYRGELDAPKNGETRKVAVPPRTAALLIEWLSAAVDPGPTAWAFASENRETPLWRDNLLRRHIRPALEKVGLGWVDF